MSPDNLNPCPPALLLAGPTAVGKSEVAMLLAEKLDGEIISVDSMQVYRGLDIGTAKPSLSDRARVRHHLIDVIDLAESFDAAQFVNLAQRAITDIQGRGRLPILCGGTGLYFKALLHGLGKTPATDPQLRGELETTPLAQLLSELAEKDPAAFTQIDRHNPRRVIRALEVIRLTGKPFSEQRAAWDTAPHSGGTRSAEREVNPFAAPLLGLARASDDLRQRIDARVEEMFRRGLVDETRLLMKQGLEKNRTAMQSLGYRQVVEHLRGERSLADTVTLVKTRTRHYAKRQMTWFRGQLAIDWVRVEPSAGASQVAAEVLAAWEAGQRPLPAH